MPDNIAQLELGVLVYGENRLRYMLGKYRTEDGEAAVSFVELPPGQCHHVARDIPLDVELSEQVLQDIARIFPGEPLLLEVPVRDEEISDSLRH